MIPITSCIFDLDGVLVDTARLHYLAWRRLALSLGFDLGLADNEALKGVSRMASLDIVLSIGGIILAEGEKRILAERKNSWYRESLAGLSADDVLPGAAAFLAACRDLGLGIALASASASAKEVLRATRLLAAFDAVVDGTDAAAPKPAPDIFLLAARRLAADPRACVVFEDAAAGVAGAKAAEMHCVGIGRPALLGGADFVIDGFAGLDAGELLKRLGGSE
jgi:beta-phosphoglucomutase